MKQLSVFAQMLQATPATSNNAASGPAATANTSTAASLTAPITPTTASSRPATTATTTTAAPSTYSSSIDQAVRAISAGASNLPGAATSSALPSLDPSMDALLNSLMADFSSASASSTASGSGAAANGSSPSMDALIDKLMTQMLSKEYLYQPMKDIAAAYPAWLTEQGNRLTAEQRRQYEQQHGCFERIVAVYERKDSTDDEVQGKEVMDIMQEMQRYGQPPKELVNDLLPPGLLGEDGLAAGGSGGAAGLGGLDGLDKGMLDEMSKNGCPMQ